QTDQHAAWTDPDVGGATEHRIGYGAGANANKQQAKLTPSPQPNRGWSPPTPCHRNHRYPTLISRLVDRDAFLVFLNFRIWRRIGVLSSRMKKRCGGDGGVHVRPRTVGAFAATAAHRIAPLTRARERADWPRPANGAQGKIQPAARGPSAVTSPRC